MYNVTVETLFITYVFSDTRLVLVDVDGSQEASLEVDSVFILDK